MQHSIQGSICGFLASEEGRVSAKAPLTLGVATGSLLLAQVMRPSSTAAHLVCDAENPCPPGEVCIEWPEDHGSGTIEKHADGFEF